MRQHDGRRAALDEVRGGRVGAVALACFALTVAMTADRWPAPIVLIVGLGTWTIAAVALWRILLARG